MTSTRNTQFGELLTEGIRDVAARQHKRVTDVDWDLSIKTGYSIHTIHKWKRGHRLPTEIDTVEIIIKYCVKQGRVGQNWARQILTKADYPSKDIFLKDLFPEQLQSGKEVTLYTNLPQCFRLFIGRKAELHKLLQELDRNWPVITIYGIAGTGKTTLAIEAASRCQIGPSLQINNPFDAVVWISGNNQPEQNEWLNEVLDTIARVLKSPFITKESQMQKIDEVDIQLRQKRTLIILDSFESMKDDKQLSDWVMRVPNPSKILITYRHNPIKSPFGGMYINLRGLIESEAIEFINDEFRRLEIPPNDCDLKPLIRVTRGNPKAIELIMRHVKWGIVKLSNIKKHLRNKTGVSEEIFDILFNHSWKELSKEGKYLLMVASFFADSASKEALGNIVDLKESELESALKQLTELSLLEVCEDDQPRYSLHPLTRFFAEDKLKIDLKFKSKARRRWIRYYLEFTDCHVKREYPKERYWNTLGGGHSNTQIDVEWPNLLNVLMWADKSNEKEILLEFMILLAHYLDRQAYYFERKKYAYKAVKAAGKLDRKVDEALLRIDALGNIYTKERKFDEADQFIKEGLDIAENLMRNGNRENTDIRDLFALGYAFLSRVSLFRGDVENALKLINKALDDVSDCCQPVIHRVLVTAGEVTYKQKKHDLSIKYYEEALEVAQQYCKDDESEIAGTRHKLGFSYLKFGDIDKAKSNFYQVSKIKETGGVLNYLHAQFGLAHILNVEGKSNEACKLARKTLEELKRVSSEHRLLQDIQDFLKQLT